MWRRVNTDDIVRHLKPWELDRVAGYVFLELILAGCATNQIVEKRIEMRPLGLAEKHYPT